MSIAAPIYKESWYNGVIREKDDSQASPAMRSPFITTIMNLSTMLMIELSEICTLPLKPKANVSTTTWSFKP
jgi:hypothetical protein